jgi:amidase
VDNITFSSASALARRIRRRDVTAEEVVDAYLQRVDLVNPTINAMIQIVGEQARAEARRADAALARGESVGPLHGVPITVKDNMAVAGLPCTSGTLGRAHWMPEQDASTVARLKAAGAIVLGKTNLPELGVAFETDNLIYGRTNNPYDLHRVPGGSSGGEAAIIAAGGSPLGLGNDSAGSIRVPAHFCGVAGIRPTTGRVSRMGMFVPASGLYDRLCQVGLLARYVEDLALALPIISGPDWQDADVVDMPLGEPANVDLKTLRIAFFTSNLIAPPTPETVATVQRSASALADVARDVTEERPSGIEQSFELFMGLLMGDGGHAFDRFLAESGTTQLHPLLDGLLAIQRAQAMPLTSLLDTLVTWDQFRHRLVSFWSDHDVLICPVCAFPAPLHGETLAPDKLPGFSYTVTFNLTGWPAVVVRAGTSPEGLPIGVQVVAAPWREDVALAVAQEIERKVGGWQPPAMGQGG